MGRPRIRPLLKTNCAYCGIEIEVSQSRGQERYYCCKEHYWKDKVGKEPSNKKWRNADIVSEYRRISELLGHRPTVEDIREHSKIYISTYHKRFGTLDNLNKFVFPDSDPNEDIGDWTLDNVSSEDGGWLAGVCVGEACFRITKTNPRRKNGNPRYNASFQIQLRADDIGLLQEVKRLWGLDETIMIWRRERDRRRGIRAGDGAKLIVTNPIILSNRIIPTLEKFPMRGKKQADLKLMKRGLQIILDRRAQGRRLSKYTEKELAELEQIFLAAKEIKTYQSTVEDILERYSAIVYGD